jgi:hypothetical protein
MRACLHHRYDASRSVDMGGRARVAVAAMQDALNALQPGASRREMGEAAAQAAEGAFDA